MWQLTIQENGVDKEHRPELRLSVPASVDHLIGVLLALLLVCNVSTHCDTCSGLSSCAELDSGCLSACGLCVWCYIERFHHVITIPYTRNKLSSECTTCAVCY